MEDTLTSLTSLGSSINGIVGAVKGTTPKAQPGTPAATAGAAPVAAKPAWQKYALWGGGALVALLVLGFLFKRK